MKKSELYKSIAAKHAPTDATIVPVEDTGDGHRGRTWPQLGRIEVPEPNTVGRLWLNLHEFAHWKLHRNAKPSTHTRAQLEAEADLASMKIMDEEGVRIPFHVLNTEEGCLHYVTLEERGKEQPPVVAECLEEIRGRTKAAANELNARRDRKKVNSELSNAAYVAARSTAVSREEFLRLAAELYNKHADTWLEWQAKYGKLLAA